MLVRARIVLQSPAQSPASVHLHRARLFRDKDSLAKAAELIAECGYGRREEELADAQAALAFHEQQQG